MSQYLKVIDTLTGTPCPWCGEPIGPGFVVTEVRPGQWVTICTDCDLATEEAGGK